MSLPESQGRGRGRRDGGGSLSGAAPAAKKKAGDYERQHPHHTCELRGSISTRAAHRRQARKKRSRKSKRAAAASAGVGSRAEERARQPAAAEEEAEEEELSRQLAVREARASYSRRLRKWSSSLCLCLFLSVSLAALFSCSVWWVALFMLRAWPRGLHQLQRLDAPLTNVHRRIVKDFRFCPAYMCDFFSWLRALRPIEGTTRRAVSAVATWAHGTHLRGSQKRPSTLVTAVVCGL